MIKINIPYNKREYIEAEHLKEFKNKIEERIEEHILGLTDPEYISLMNYIKDELDIILCGNKTQLETIIDHIEKNYFISDTKLSKILGRREKGIPRNNLEDYLKRFAHNQGFFNYIIDPNAYKKVKDFKEAGQQLKNEFKEYKENLKKIFDYDEFTQKDEGWNAYEFVSQLDVTVCPYCNRQFIHTLNKDGKKARATLDHYYARSLYPYLGLSLYNLIPSCYFCNSSFKGDIDLYKNEAIYPYEEDFSNYAKFRTDFQDQDSYDYEYLIGISKDFEIKLSLNESMLDEELKKKIIRSKEVFALEELYEFHKDYVRDLIRTAIVNDSSRIDEIYTMYPELFKNREEVLQAVFLNYLNEENFGKRALAKLTKDICDELDIFK